MNSQDKFEVWATEYLPTLYLTKTDGGAYASPITRMCFMGWSARDEEVECITGQNQRLRAGVESDLAEIDRIQAEYDAHFRKTRLYRIQRDQAKDDSDNLRAECEALRKLLLEASEEVASWGAYASEYYQEKHDLAGCVARLHDAALSKEASRG